MTAPSRDVYDNKENTFVKIQHFLTLATVGAAFYCVCSASAQTTSPAYSFGVVNQTSSNGSMTFPVYDPVTFGSSQISEIFADGFTQTLSLGGIQAQDTAQSSAQFLTLNNGTFSDPIHGTLTSAVLSGTLAFPGLIADGSGTLSLTLQPTIDPNSQYSQTVLTPFTASLFGPASTGIGIGTFRLLDSSNQPVDSVVIDATAAPVPEAPTTVSLGLLFALGLGSLILTRRKTTLTH